MKKKFNVSLILGFLLYLFVSVPALSATIQYQYDDLNRLTKVEYDNGSTEYTYDENGNRITKATTLKSYTVTIQKAGTGDGTLSQSTQTVSYGSDLTVTATPAESSVFAGWSGDATGTGDAVLTNITSDKTITATFDLKSYTAGDVDQNGTVDLSDAILILQIMVETSENQGIHKDADINGDGRLGIEELLYILQKTSELR